MAATAFHPPALPLTFDPRASYSTTPYYLPSSPSPSELELTYSPLTRGRDTSPRPLLNLHSPPHTPPASHAPLAFTRRSSGSGSTSNVAHVIQAHHTLPNTIDNIPSDPVLYLPPLLSPLPHGVKHDHTHDHGHEHSLQEELQSFTTRLPDIDPASLALHQVLHYFRPLDDDYSRQDYPDAFNWSSINLPEDVEREWYCVVFRSKRNAASSSLSLYQADREAHEEAVKNGGLVMYWYGVPDESGSNLATCIWQSRRHAVNAIGGPKHRKAMMQAKDAYEVYDLERWVLKKEAGETGVSLERWDGRSEVGW